MTRAAKSPDAKPDVVRRGQERSGAPFAPGDLVVYPGHGVGRVVSIETQTVGGADLSLVVVGFDQDGMVMRVPFQKVKSAGLRPVSSAAAMRDVLTRLAAPAAAVRGIWNRRVVEYMAKVNSGDPLSLAEVVRDLHRSARGRERSPAEQTVYERAFGRLSDELAAVERTDRDAAAAKLDLVLNDV